MMPHFLSLIKADIQAIYERDPAAKNLLEVISYPGLHAVLIHRLTHPLYQMGIPVLPRWINHFSRFLTGIDIHPGAQIGPGFFIDHGMGVVIGETCIIGENVLVYQGVTLGGTGKDRGKRHPTLGNGVVVGAGAKVLGDIKIGDNCRIGAGSVVVKSIMPNATVVGVPGRVIFCEGEKVETLNHQDLPDPVLHILEAMQDRIEKLEVNLARLKKENQTLKSQPGALLRGINALES